MDLDLRSRKELPIGTCCTRRNGHHACVSRRTRYDVGDGLTAIADDVAPLLSGLPPTPIELCAVAEGLIVLPDLAVGFGIPEVRQGERSIRAASDIIRTLIALDDAPIDQNRSFSDRIVGTCRHFAVLSCALLRYRGSRPDRAVASPRTSSPAASSITGSSSTGSRPTIAGYASTPRSSGSTSSPLPRISRPVSSSPAARRGLCAGGDGRPVEFGVDGFPDVWGIGEVRGNAIRDLAA